ARVGWGGGRGLGGGRVDSVGGGGRALAARPDTCACSSLRSLGAEARGRLVPPRLGREARDRAWRENAMQAATCVGSTVLAAFLALAGPRAALAITPDAWITTRAKMALLATDDLRRATIKVDTVHGRGTLT